MLTLFWPSYILATVRLFENAPHTKRPFWHLWTSCLFCVLPINKQKHTYFGEPLNKYSCQVWFHNWRSGFREDSQNWQDPFWRKRALISFVYLLLFKWPSNKHFLPSVMSFWPVVSKKKIKMWNLTDDNNDDADDNHDDRRRRTPRDGNTSHDHLGRVS